MIKEPEDALNDKSSSNTKVRLQRDEVEILES